MLLGLAYRMLGSCAEAEDAVQDAFLKWQHADKDKIENPAAWLTTICTRRCIDLLRAAYRIRVDYLGTWLPEPIQTDNNMAEEKIALSSSLTTAFLLMLERLTPKERAAYLLHEIFDVDYPEIAKVLDISENACRKLVLRAHANIGREQVRHVTPPERQEQLLAAFRSAVDGGGTGPLVALLSDDIELSADGGGKVPTILLPLRGKADVLDFIVRNLSSWWRDFHWISAGVNGVRGVILQQDGVTMVAISFAYDATGKATDIHVVRNPDKLRHLSARSSAAARSR